MTAVAPHDDGAVHRRRTREGILFSSGRRGLRSTEQLVMVESIQSSNILLWTKPLETAGGMFANRISTIFAVDLFFVVLVTFVWMYDEARQSRIKRVWLFWLLTLLFGLAGALPLFLHARLRALEARVAASQW